MALQSQTARPATRRSYMYRRPRRKRTRAVVVVLIGLAAVLVGIKLLLSNIGAPGSGEQPQAASGTKSNFAAPPTAAAANVSEPLDSTPTARAPQQVAAADEAADHIPADPTGSEAASAPTANRVEIADSPSQQPLGIAAAPPSSQAKQRAMQRLEAGMTLAETNRLIQARRMLTAALESNALAPAEAQRARDALAALNQRLVFSPQIVESDPFTRPYVVQPSERLGGIVKEQSLKVDWRFIMRINGIQDERRVRAGRRLKLVTGPFHAVVHKSDFRLDLYLGTGVNRVFVASYPAGLGEYDSTPTGMFRVRAGSKLINPAWTNPRTGQRFDRHDPQNPIGERWIGLEGIDEAVRDLIGYGIHGTIEPQTVGRQSSMGCIRMLPDDVEIIYEVLMERISTVEIRP